jgi:hypothetical protein
MARILLAMEIHDCDAWKDCPKYKLCRDLLPHITAEHTCIQTLNQSQPLIDLLNCVGQIWVSCLLLDLQILKHHTDCTGMNSTVHVLDQ